MWIVELKRLQDHTEYICMYVYVYIYRIFRQWPAPMVVEGKRNKTSEIWLTREMNDEQR